MWVITALPREILQHIFAFIPASDLAANTSRVSKLFYELGEDPVFWKRKCVREFCVGITGNVYPPNDWRKEFLVMNGDWETLTSNSLRRDVKYTDTAHIEVDELSKTIVFSNLRPREGTTNLAPITVQSMGPLRPLPLGDFSVGYYEIKLLHGGEEQMIGLGLARNDYLDAMPGWKKGSIGYHGDDGRVFIGCGYGRSLTEPWGIGEVFGCGVDFRRKYVFFTKNGLLLGTYPLRRAEGLYPTLGSRTQGETVSVNFGQRSFCFDIVQYQVNMAEQSPPRPGQVAVPYSKLVYSCKPQANISQVPYDVEDDVEDEDNEFDDKGMNKASQYFNSVLRVLMNAEDYPNDDGSVESLVAVLRNQMNETGIALPPHMEMADLRNALSNQIQFNKQSALLAYFLRVYEEGVKPPPSDNILPRDEFPKVEIIKCIATLLIDDYRDDHPLVLNTINRGRMLFNFQPPPGMTIMQERGQLSLVLSREIQAHERERRTKRREIFKNLRENEPTFYYYNEYAPPVKDYSILLGSSDELPISTLQTSSSSNTLAITNNNNDTNNNNNNNNDIVVENNNQLAIANNNTNNNNNNNNDDDDQLVNNSFQTILDELMGNEGNNNTTTNTTVNNNNTTNAENTNNNEVAIPENPEEQPTLSPQQFQDMLKSYVDLLEDRLIADEHPRITAAICQWYSTLDIEMKPEMQISIERNRLIKILSHLRTKVDEHIEDHNATSLLSRTGLRFKRYCKNLFKTDKVKLSLFVMIGLFVARSVQKRKP